MMKNPLALTLLALTLLPRLDAQQPETISPNLLRLEGTDRRQHIHYLRFILLLNAPGNPSTPPDSLPRFTIECREQNSKRSLHLLVRFTGSPNFDFTPPEIAEAGANFARMNPSTNLKMRFEGYTHSPEFKRQWEILPTGELHYRNPGIDSTNLDNPQLFWQWLRSLPNLRISYVKPISGQPAELVFPTQPLLEQVKKAELCQP